MSSYVGVVASCLQYCLFVFQTNRTAEGRCASTVQQALPPSSSPSSSSSSSSSSSPSSSSSSSSFAILNPPPALSCSSTGSHVSGKHNYQLTYTVALILFVLVVGVVYSLSAAVVSSGAQHDDHELKVLAHSYAALVKERLLLRVAELRHAVEVSLLLGQDAGTWSSAGARLHLSDCVSPQVVEWVPTMQPHLLSLLKHRPHILAGLQLMTSRNNNSTVQCLPFGTSLSSFVDGVFVPASSVHQRLNHSHTLQLYEATVTGRLLTSTPVASKLGEAIPVYLPVSNHHNRTLRQAILALIPTATLLSPIARTSSAALKCHFEYIASDVAATVDGSGSTSVTYFTLGGYKHGLRCTRLPASQALGWPSLPNMLVLCIGALLLLNIMVFVYVRHYLSARLLEQADAWYTEAQRLASTASEAKSDFLAFLCHELRNPLHSICAMVDILSQSATCLMTMSTDDKRCFKVIRSAAHTMNVIVNDALDLEKINARKIVIQCIPFSLSDAIHTLLQSFLQRALAKQIILSADIPSTLPSVLYSDPTRVHQVLNNIVDNAIKFHDKPGGGSVSLKITHGPVMHPTQSKQCVETSPSSLFRSWSPLSLFARSTTTASDSLQNSNIPRSVSEASVNSATPSLLPCCTVDITVTDDGPGIDESRLSSIFRPYAFAKLPKLSTMPVGAGLGLTVSQRVVEMMGGSLTICSNPDSGTQVQIRLVLPVGDTSMPAPSPFSTPLTTPSSTPNQLLRMRRLPHQSPINASDADSVRSLPESLPFRDPSSTEPTSISPSGYAADHSCAPLHVPSHNAKLDVARDTMQPQSSLPPLPPSVAAKKTVLGACSMLQHSDQHTPAGRRGVPRPLLASPTTIIGNIATRAESVVREQRPENHHSEKQTNVELPPAATDISVTRHWSGSSTSVSPSSATTTIEKNSPTANHAYSDVCILCVDDSPINLKILSRMLTGFHLVLAENGQQAVQLVKELAAGEIAVEVPQRTRQARQFDLILSDIIMPIMTGLEACTEIRAFEKEQFLAPVPMVAVTANADLQGRTAAASAGFDLYLSKPFTKKDLMAVVHTTLQRSNHFALSGARRSLSQPQPQQQFSYQSAVVDGELQAHQADKQDSRSQSCVPSDSPSTPCNRANSPVSPTLSSIAPIYPTQRPSPSAVMLKRAVASTAVSQQHDKQFYESRND